MDFECIFIMNKTSSSRNHNRVQRRQKDESLARHNLHQTKIMAASAGY